MANFLKLNGNFLAIGSNVVSTDQTPPDLPGQVQNLSFSNETEDGADASWSAPSSGGSPIGYFVFLNGSLHTTIDAPTTTYTFTGLSASTTYNVYVVAFNVGGSGTASTTESFTTLAMSSGVTLYSMAEWLDTQSQFSASERQTLLARRYATNISSSGADFIADDFEIPASFTWSEGNSWVDDYMGYKHTLVANNRTIKNCERWIINDAGIFFYTHGGGATERRLRFFFRGQPYNVLGGPSNQITLTVNGSSGTEGQQRADNAWFLTDSILAYVTGDDEISTIDILSGATTTLTIPFSGSEAINLSTSDGNDVRRPYDNPVMNPEKLAYNTANPTASIDDDKNYRLFPVSSDKKDYIILVYTLSTGAWTYLDSSGATVTESATPVVHTLDLNGSTSVDYVALNPSGKRVIGNTSGQGFTYHYVDGTYVGNVYANSNHKSIGPIKDGLDLFSEKLTGSSPDNAVLGGKAGDMFVLQFDPTNEVRPVGLASVILPSGDTALYAGGDQGSHNGCPLIAYAGLRDFAPQPKEIWKKQIIMMDPEYSDHPTYNSIYGRFRVAQLNINRTSGGDALDPGALPDVCYEVPGEPGKYMTGVYWFDTDIDHNGTLRNGMFYTEIQMIPDTDNFATLNAALTAADLESRQ